MSHPSFSLLGSRLLLACCVLLQLPIQASPAQAAPADSQPAAVAAPAAAEAFTGDWQGTIALPQQPLTIRLQLQFSDGHWHGSVDIPQQQAEQLPLVDFQLADGQLRFRIQGVPGDPTFSGRLSAEGFSGTFSQGGQSFDFRLQRPQTATDPDPAELTRQLRARIQAALAAWHTPGVAVAVIRDDRVLLSEGFGERDLDRHLPVTAETLFAIGSSTKAFTATALGLLVDQGKLDWDAPIRTALPDFELQDPVATQGISARDLLTHRSGLPRHDLVWYASGQSRQELYHSLRYLEPSAPFRSRFQYNNLMYTTAGLLLEKLSGSSWEDFVRQHLFQPLGMSRSTTSSAEMQADSDHALPYRLSEDKPVEMPFRPIDAIAPAGGIHASIRDMTRWLRFNLNQGRLADGQQLLAASTLAEIQSPQQVVASTGSPESPYILYGLGWFIQPYRGHTLLQHGGNIDGFTAMVSLMPQDHLGVVVLSNKNGDLLPTALMYAIDDLLLGLEPIDWNSRLKGAPAGEVVQAATTAYPRTSGTRPGHALDDYTGVYSHPAYGEVQIERRGDALAMRYRHLGGPLQHWHYDSFRVDTGSQHDAGQMVNFFSGELGDVAALEMSLEPSVKPIRFSHQIDPRLRLPAVLERYAGHYRIATTEIALRVENGKLLMHLAGQPVFELEPFRPQLFRLKEIAGYLARFELQNGKVVALTMIQPNGVFKAERVGP